MLNFTKTKYIFKNKLEKKLEEFYSIPMGLLKAMKFPGIAFPKNHSLRIYVLIPIIDRSGSANTYYENTCHWPVRPSSLPAAPAGGKAMSFNSKEIRSFSSKPPLLAESAVSGKQTRQIRVWQLVETQYRTTVFHS